MSASFERELYTRRATPTFHWSAILAGLAVALGVQVFLTAIGGAIGLAAAIPATANDANTARGIGIGAGVWTVLSPLVSMFIGAYVASYLSRPVDRGAAAINGIAVWALSLLAGVLIVGGAATSAASGLLSGAANGATNGGAIAAGQTASQPREQREQLRADVNQKKVEAQRKLDANREEIQDKANQTAKATTGVAWAGVFAMLLSLVSAVFGSMLGLPEFLRNNRLDRGMRRDRDTLVTAGEERPTAHPTTLVTPTDFHDELH